MINNQTEDAGNGVDLNDYHYDTEAIAQRAAEILKGNKPYQKLYKKLQLLNPKRDMMKIALLQSQLREIESDEMNRLIELEENSRKKVRNIAVLLERIAPNEAAKYQEMMAGLSLLLDMIDTSFSDINKLLRRNSIGVEMNNFPELEAAKKLVWKMVFAEQKKMQTYQDNLWSEESGRLYTYLQARCAVYRRKVERVEGKLKKGNVK